MNPVWKEHNQPRTDNFMQTLAFLWFELQPAQQCLRETFSESQIPAKAGMALSFFFGEGEFMNLLRMFLAPTIAVGMVLTVPPSDCCGLVVQGYSWGKERHVQRTIEINLVPRNI
jgi:hypothetical protein